VDLLWRVRLVEREERRGGDWGHTSGMRERLR
jgi:hypothetical protein